MNDKAKSRFALVSAKLIALREMFLAWWPWLLLVVAGFVIAYQFVQPAPPSRVVISAGATDGAYYRFAQQYRDIFARNDIDLEVRPSSGSVENYGLLKKADSGVDIGFVQAGIGSPTEAPHLVTLGSLYHEPLWVFYRANETKDRLTQLPSERIAIGPEGSGTRQLAAVLLTANRMAVPHGGVSELGGSAAAPALQQGQVDAAFFVASPQAPVVRTLLNDGSVRVMSFSQADAYTRYFPYLSALVLPRGGIDLERDIPPNDVRLLASTANLVARDDLHPAIVTLLAVAMTEVHSRPGLFERAGEFPSVKGAVFPASRETERYFKQGPPFLQRYLPFWAAVFVERMIVLLVPLIALMLPLMRVLPTLYNWRVTSPIYKAYGQLRFLEDEVVRDPSSAKAPDYLARLDGIEARVDQLHVPLSFNHQVYTLRDHIGLVRSRISKLDSSLRSPPTAAI